jgi:FKBP-type peptidyl-prolyl cis-trans isomerase FklB
MLRTVLLSCCLMSAPLFAEIPSNEKVPEKSTTELSIAEKNLKAANIFLEENKTKSDVVTLPSGLQYKILKEGAGASANPTDFVTVQYKGTFLNGAEFDKSLEGKTPPTFAVNAVIPGWTEALQLMKPGAHWIIYVPPHLAYGRQGVGQLIGPNELLIFDIELLAVKPSLDQNQDDEWEDLG